MRDDHFSVLLYHRPLGCESAIRHGVDRAIPVIVCCYPGNASQDAARFLAGQGFKRGYSLDGGFRGCRLAGHPRE